MISSTLIYWFKTSEDDSVKLMGNFQKGNIQIVILIVLILGIAAGVYLLQFTQNFRPKAAEDQSNSAILSWTDREKVSPPYGAFEYRGTATQEFGSQYSAPGIPDNLKPKSSIIRYRDNKDSNYNYDLHITPAGMIW